MVTWNSLTYGLDAQYTTTSFHLQIIVICTLLFLSGDKEDLAYETQFYWNIDNGKILKKDTSTD
jgi:hypothetical protein